MSSINFDLRVILTLASLIGFLSALLNFLQLANGVFCFSRVQTFTSVSDPAVSQFSISGFGHNHYWRIDDFCRGADYTFCISDGKWVNCSQSYSSRRINYEYNLEMNCEETGSGLSNSFGVLIYPGLSSLSGSPGNYSNHLVNVKNFTSSCSLNQGFYFWFGVLSVNFIIACLLARLLLRSNSFGLAVKIYLKANFIYEILKSAHFFSFCCSKSNNPDFLFNGDEYMSLEEDKNERFSIDEELGLDPSKIWAWNFSSRDGENYYRIWIEEGVVRVLASDNLGVESCSGEPGKKMIMVKRYILGRSKGVHCLIPGGSHNLNLSEFLNHYNDNLILKKRFWFGPRKVVLGGWEPSNPQKASKRRIIEHFKSFFGYYSEEAVSLALSGRLVKPNLGFIKNTEWKIYLSDLYFHLGQRPDSKTKRFNKSRSFDLTPTGKIKTDPEIDTLVRMEKSFVKRVKEGVEFEGKPKVVLSEEGDREAVEKDLRKKLDWDNVYTGLVSGVKWPKDNKVVVNGSKINSVSWAVKNNPDLLIDSLNRLPNFEISERVGLTLSSITEEEEKLKMIDLISSFEVETMRGTFVPASPEKTNEEIARIKSAMKEEEREVNFRNHGRSLERKMKALNKRFEEKNKTIERMSAEIIGKMSREEELIKKEFENCFKLAGSAEVREFVKNVSWEKNVVKKKPKGETKKGAGKSKPKSLKNCFLEELGDKKNTKDYKYIKDSLIEALSECDKEGKIPGYGSLKITHRSFSYKLPKSLKRTYKLARKRVMGGRKKLDQSRVWEKGVTDVDRIYKGAFRMILFYSIASRGGLIEGSRENTEVFLDLLNLGRNTGVINKNTVSMLENLRTING
jgi:hypothetical protein